MSTAWRYASLAIVVMVMVLFPTGVSGDTDNNDSLAYPERIGPGVTWGNVTLRYEGDWPNITTVSDDDAYVYSMPQKSSVNVTLRKWDLSRTELYITFYTVEGFRLQGVDTARVSIPGQADRAVLENKLPVASDIVILVGGNGTYTLDIRPSALISQDDDDGEVDGLDWIYAQTIGDGTYNGSLPDPKGLPVRYHKVIVPVDHVLKITLLRRDNSSGMLNLETFTPFREVSYTDIRIRVNREDRKDADTYDNYDDEVVEKIIRVYGSGNYSITIDTSQEVEDYQEEMLIFLLVMVLMSLFAVVVPMLIPLTFVVIGVIILVVVLKRTKRTTDPPQTPSIATEPPKKGPKKRSKVEKVPDDHTSLKR